MYPIATTYRAAALTWRQRDILFDLLEHDKSTQGTVTARNIAFRLNRSPEAMHTSLNTLDTRGFVSSECMDAVGDERLYWFITDEGIEAVNNLEGE